MKIGIMGNVSAGLKLLLLSRLPQDIEIVEITKKQAEENKRKTVVIDAGVIFSPDISRLFPKPIIPPRFDGKTGSNKSDRKRNRKNRWR